MEFLRQPWGTAMFIISNNKYILNIMVMRRLQLYQDAVISCF